MRFAASDMLTIQAEKQIVTRCPGEFQASHGQSYRSADMVAALDALNRGDPVHPLDQLRAALGQSLPPRLDARIKVSVVARIDRLFMSAGMMNEYAIARCPRIKILDAMAGGAFRAGWNKDSQALTARDGSRRRR